MKFELFVDTKLQLKLSVICLYDAVHKLHGITLNYLHICCPKTPFPPKISISQSSNITKTFISQIFANFFGHQSSATDILKGHPERVNNY